MRSEQRGGGVAIYVSECLQAEVLHTVKTLSPSR